MSLIDRLRAATGPDRELADEVLLACGWTVKEKYHQAADIWISPNGSKHRYRNRPNPLASIDAALGLVPEEASVHLHIMPREMGHKAEVGIHYVGEHSIPAIALCIAALTARGVK